MLDIGSIERLIGFVENLLSLDSNPGLPHTFNYGNLLVKITPKGDKVNDTDGDGIESIDVLLNSGILNPAATGFLVVFKNYLELNKINSLFSHLDRGGLCVYLPKLVVKLDVIDAEAEVIANAIYEQLGCIEPVSFKYTTVNNQQVSVSIQTNETVQKAPPSVVEDDDELHEFIRELDFYVSDIIEAPASSICYKPNGLIMHFEYTQIEINID